jgi:cell division septation protein DedD
MARYPRTSLRYGLTLLLAGWVLMSAWTLPPPARSAERLTKHAPVVRVELAYDLPQQEADKLRRVFRQEGFWATVGKKTDQPGLYRVSLGTFRSPSLARQLAQGVSKRLTLSTAVTPALAPDVSYPKPTARSSYWTLEIGVFTVRKKALKLRDHWRSLGYPYYVVRQTDSKGASWWCVRVGLFTDRTAARRTAELFDQEQGKPLIPLEVSQTSLTSSAEGELPDNFLLATESPETGIPAPAAAKATPRPKTASSKPAPKTVSAEQQVRKKSVPTLRKTAAAKSTSKTVPAIPEKFWTLHIGAFSIKQNALNYRDHWKAKGYPFYVIKLRNDKGRAWWMTRMGIYKNKTAARKAARDFTQHEGKKLYLRSLERKLYQRRLVP